MINFSNYMVQHILYINSVQRCLNHGTHFEHKQPTECAFGKMFYSEIKPNFERFCEEKKQLIEHIEKIHNAFHEAAFHISSDNPDIEKATQDAWLYSTQLVNMLNRLEKM
ncbi:MAG: CZB domain-containing protein [Methylococcaceae bacterium]